MRGWVTNEEKAVVRELEYRFNLVWATFSFDFHLEVFNMHIKIIVQRSVQSTLYKS